MDILRSKDSYEVQIARQQLAALSMSSRSCCIQHSTWNLECCVLLIWLHHKYFLVLHALCPLTVVFIKSFHPCTTHASELWSSHPHMSNPSALQNLICGTFLHNSLSLAQAWCKKVHGLNLNLNCKFYFWEDRASNSNLLSTFEGCKSLTLGYYLHIRCRKFCKSHLLVASLPWEYVKCSCSPHSHDSGNIAAQRWQSAQSQVMTPDSVPISFFWEAEIG